jgi:mRNA interferase HicA
MKRTKLLKHLRQHQCDILREGTRHTILYNRETNARSSLPRHPEIVPLTVAMICQQLGVPKPSEK